MRIGIRISDHISVFPAAETVETLVQLHAGIVIVVERAQGHYAAVYCQPIVFCRLAGCDEAFDCFEVCHIILPFIYFGSRKRKTT